MTRDVPTQEVRMNLFEVREDRLLDSNGGQWSPLKDFLLNSEKSKF